MKRIRLIGKTKKLARFLFSALLLIMNGLLAGSNEDLPLFGRWKLREVVLQEPSRQLTAFAAMNVFDIVGDSNGCFYVLFSGSGKRGDHRAAWGVEGGASPQSLSPKYKIVKFNPDGALIATISPPPHAEEEFTSPHKLYVDGRDHLFVRDIDRINEFDQALKFVRRINFPFRYSPGKADFLISDDLEIFALAQEYTGKGIDKILLKCEIPGGRFKIIESYEDADYQARKGPQGQMGFSRTEDEYSRKPILRSFPGPALCYAVSSEFKLKIYALDGCLVDTIFFPENRMAISPEEKAALKISSDSSTAFKPFCSTFFTDEKGRIFILRPKFFYAQKPGQSIDVFSREGKFLYRIQIARAPISMARGAFFTWFQDYQNNRTILTKYEIEDYERMKY